MTREATDPRWDVLCAGIVVADHICRPVPRLPPPGGLVLTDGMALSVGGCAANVAVDLSNLGRRSAIAGCIGDDTFGRHVDEVLRSAGVDCKCLQARPDSETACTMVLNVAGEDRRFIHVLGANADFSGDELTPQVVARARALYVGGYGLVESLSPQNVFRLFSTARDHGVTTVLDVVLAEPRDYRTWLQPVLPLTDLFLPNSDEAEMLLGEADPLRQAETFHADGAGIALVTCGPDGAVLVGDEGRWRSAAHRVKTVDGTGSGDAFLAGLLHARFNDDDWPAALRYGSALGARCAESPGATTGLPDAAELEQFVRDHPLDVVEG
ncbi:MAG: carbohydrate kinase family protein [Planctomycetaceae bacterium]